MAYKSELLNQRMFPVVHLGEVQEFLHIVTDIFPLFHIIPIFMRMGGLRGIPFMPEEANLSVMLE